jgi:cardiolipin synthase
VVGELQKLFLDTWQKQQAEPLAARDYFPRLEPAGTEIVRAIGSTPDDPYSQMYLTLISAIGNAERSVYITNAYFVPDPQFMQTLMDAAKRGVDVILVLPSYSDSGLVFHAARSNYAMLLDAGVQIYEHMDALLHAKTAVIDGTWSTVGSSNLDWRSFADNDEVNAVVLGVDFGHQMLQAFADDMKDSREITADTWKQRALALRLKEWFARRLQRLL